jgi:fructan beta-fructosidase
MHWGHAVSRDLVHWEHLPIALYPDSLGYIFSGSAVVDANNTSGFGRDGRPPLVALFTYHDPEGEKAGRNDYQYQAIAYSLDRGRTWTKYEGNPVVPNPGIRDFRDPKVFWHEASGRWVMIFAALDRVRLYASPDLRDWTFASEWGEKTGSHEGVWECPDLFELPVEGTDEKRWVMLLSINPGGPQGGSATQYFVGDFDGTTFTVDETFAGAMDAETDFDRSLWIDYGRDNYAGVTWSDVPAADGRRLFMGWMSNWDYAQVVPTEGWRSAMTLPRALSLRNMPHGPRLLARPVRELEALRRASREVETRTVEGELDLTGQLGFAPTLLEAVLEFELPAGAAPDFGVELSNAGGERYRVGYDAAGKQYYSDRTRAGEHAFSDKFAPRPTVAPRRTDVSAVRLHLFFDVASVELFADDGATVMTDIFFPTTPFDRLRLYSENGNVELKNARFYELKSIWTQQ